LANLCLCAGWSLSLGGGAPLTQTVETFSTSPGAALSAVLAQDPTSADQLRVLHDFQPAAGAANLYEISVSVVNLGPTRVQPTYSHRFDWTGGPPDPSVVLIDPSLGQLQLTPDGRGLQFLVGLPPIEPGQTAGLRLFLGAGRGPVEANAGLVSNGARLISQSTVGPTTFVLGYAAGLQPSTAASSGGGGDGGGDGAGGGGGGGGAGGDASSTNPSPPPTTPLPNPPATDPSPGLTPNPPATDPNPNPNPNPKPAAPPATTPDPTPPEPTPPSTTTPPANPAPPSTTTPPSGGPGPGDANPPKSPTDLLLPPQFDLPAHTDSLQATPELDSLSLLASGLAGVGGYALLRFRSATGRRRERLDAEDQDQAA
jgi:hypothetical protein